MNTQNRRKFLGLLGAGLAGVPAFSVANDSKFSTRKYTREKIVRTLGKTGIQLPVVSMGVMNASNPNLLKEAWKQGIRHFDTAWFYQGGNNEMMVGKVLKELNVKREEVTIATKVFLWDKPVDSLTGKEIKDLFLERYAQSLQRLQLDYADILYFHNVFTVDQVHNPYILEAFTELKEQKKLRFAGFSTHVDWRQQVNEAADREFYDIILLSYNYSMAGDEEAREAMKKAAARGIGLVAMKTLCQQDWYKAGLPAEMQKFYEGQIMHPALLKWVLQHEYITTAIPGFTNFQQLEEDLLVAESLEYTQEEEIFLKDHQVKLALQSNCRFCGKCKPGCPAGADIPNLMRVHAYAFSYGNTVLANQTYRCLDNGNALESCKNCKACTVQCVHNVPVVNRLKDLNQVYV